MAKTSRAILTGVKENPGCDLDTIKAIVRAFLGSETFSDEHLGYSVRRLVYDKRIILADRLYYPPVEELTDNQLLLLVTRLELYTAMRRRVFAEIRKRMKEGRDANYNN